MIPGPLTLEQRQALRQLLNERLSALRRELAAAVRPSPAEDSPHLSNAHGDADDAVADLELDIDVAELDRDAQELAAVSAAIERIDSTVFGLCAECGEPIGWERLKAVPHTRNCIGCEARVEHGARSPAATRL
jgi:RNA polymerase-binding protein DksA